MKKAVMPVMTVCCILLNIQYIFGQWTRKADAVELRSDLPGSVLYNGKIYVFFGFYDSSLHILSNVEVYDPVANEWSLLSSAPVGKAVTHEGIVLVDDNVWHIGGRVGNHPGPFTSETWIYNITTDSWSRGPDIIDPATGTPIPWAAGGAALIDRTIHLFGGMAVTACKGDQSKYHLTLNVDEWLANPANPARWKNDLALMPVPRNHFSTVVLGGKIYALGGQFGHDCGGGQDQRYSHVYDVVTNTWTQLPIMAYARSHCEAGTFAMDGKIYLVGGQGQSGQSIRTVTRFDPAGNNGAGAWYDDPALYLPTVYEGMSAKVFGNNIIASHGGVSSSRRPQRLTYVYPFPRTPVRQLRFATDSLLLDGFTAAPVDTSTLIFTIDDNTDYTITSGADWLSVENNAAGTVGRNGRYLALKANTTSLASGEYNTSVIAVATGSADTFTGDTLSVKLIVCDGAPETSGADCYLDADHDGYGNVSAVRRTCSLPAGYVLTAGDCNDNSARIHPGAPDLCNNIDDDCDGAIDEDCPKIILDTPSVLEGNSGTKYLRFTVYLDRPCPVASSVKYATQNVTATTADYTAKSGTLYFAAGVTSMFVNVVIRADITDEWNESLRLNLTQPVNARIKLTSSNGTIIDDDPLPYLIMLDTFTTENALSAKLRIKLSLASGKTIRTKFYTKNGTAIAPGDYTAQTAGLVTFLAGEKEKYISVAVQKDAVNEATETFQAALKEPENVSITATGSRSLATVSLRNSTPTITAGILEPPANESQKPALITVAPNPSPTEFVISWNGMHGSLINVQADDFLGRTIERRTRVSTNETTRIGANWKQGTYFIHIIGNGKKTTFKLIKK